MHDCRGLFVTRDAPIACHQEMPWEGGKDQVCTPCSVTGIYILPSRKRHTLTIHLRHSDLNSEPGPAGPRPCLWSPMPPVFPHRRGHHPGILRPRPPQRLRLSRVGTRLSGPSTEPGIRSEVRGGEKETPTKEHPQGGKISKDGEEEREMMTYLLVNRMNFGFKGQTLQQQQPFDNLL